MSVPRKKHSRLFKMKVAKEALSGNKTLTQLSSEYGVHVSQIKEWRAQALEAMNERFSQRRGRKKKGEIEDKRLFEEIGRLKIELDFLREKLGS